MDITLLLLVTILLGALALTASELGVDSRDGSDDPHRPIYPVGIN